MAFQTLFAQPIGDLLELLVLEKATDQLFARIPLLIFHARFDVAGQEDLRLDLHEGGSHEDETAGDFDVEQAQLTANDGQILGGDGGDGNIVDVYLVLADEVKEQIQRSLEDVEDDAVRAFMSAG